MKPLIAGVDPGSTSAVALIDFEGKIVKLESGKNFPPSEIITEIVAEGKPVVVTSDKADTPSKVEKIATSVGAEQFEPEEDLSKKRKRELGEGENSHERDASAAAIHAYKQLRDNIKKIKEVAEEEDMETVDVAERYFTSGKELVPEDPEEGKEDEPESKEYSHFRKKAEKMEEKVEELEKKIEELEEKLEFKEQQRRDLQSKYDRLKSEKTEELLKEEEIESREKKLSEKQEKISQLQDRLKKSNIREKQYSRAIEELEKGAEIVPLVEEKAPGTEPFVTRSKSFRDRMRSKGRKVYHIDEVEGVELGARFILSNINEDAKDIIERYRDSR
jgi:predicted RNase H-like nuclease (RuvC/YqgF family)